MSGRELCGRSVWVTGSSRGIGRAIASAFAGAGCRVALHGRSFTNLRNSQEGNDLREVARELAAKSGSDVRAFQGELSLEEEVRRCAAEIRAAFGRIDFLVCCAGGASRHGEIAPGTFAGTLDFTLAEIEAMFRINLLPTLLCCREVAPEMAERGFGRIVTIGSIAGCGGHKTGGTGHTGYALAKDAVHAYTRQLAARLRHDGIPVNCVIPGNINTPTTRLRFGGDRAAPVPGEYISGECIRVDGGEQLFPC